MIIYLIGSFFYDSGVFLARQVEATVEFPPYLEKPISIKFPTSSIYDRALKVHRTATISPGSNKVEILDSVEGIENPPVVELTKPWNPFNESNEAEKCSTCRGTSVPNTRILSLRYEKNIIPSNGLATFSCAYACPSLPELQPYFTWVLDGQVSASLWFQYFLL